MIVDVHVEMHGYNPSFKYEYECDRCHKRYFVKKPIRVKYTYCSECRDIVNKERRQKEEQKALRKARKSLIRNAEELQEEIIQTLETHPSKNDVISDRNEIKKVITDIIDNSIKELKEGRKDE